MSKTTTPATAPALTITRIFDAPRDAVWGAWTDPDQIVQWAGPEGVTIVHWEADARVGGAWRLCMRHPEWGELWQHGVFHEIVPPERLVYTFAWEEANVSPEHVMLVTVAFADLGDRTEMRFQQAVFVSEASRDSHEDGWSQCFDKLAALVAG